MNARAYRYYDEAFYRGYPRFYQDFNFLDPFRIGTLQRQSTDPYNNLSDGSSGSLVAQYFLRFFAPGQGENFDRRNDITEEVNDLNIFQQLYKQPIQVWIDFNLQDITFITYNLYNT